MNNKKYLVFTLLIIIGLNYLIAQNSNYSSYGIGIKQPQVSTRMNGLGYSGSAIYDSLGTTSFNPALWYGFRTVSLTGKAGYSKMDPTRVQNDTRMGMLKGFSIKMPITRYGGMVLGIRPTTRANSEIEMKKNNSVKIKGGISELYFGGGYRITRKLSAGLISRFLFGKYSHISKVNARNATYYDNLDKNIQGNILGMGLFWNNPDNYSIALQYDYSIDFAYNRINEFYKIEGNNQEYLDNDTTSFKRIEYPSKIKIGISKNLSERLVVSSDMNYSKKMDTEFQISPDNEIEYTDSYLFGLGLERRPSDDFNPGFLDKMCYRVGGFYEKGNIENDKGKGRIKKGITTGIGIPFNNYFNRLDLSLTYSETTGFLEQKIGKEKKLSIKIGLTSGGVWFSNALNY